MPPRDRNPDRAPLDSVFRDPVGDDQPPPAPTLFEPSWQEVHGDCARLANMLRQVPVTTILAVARGGMVPACVLAQLLDVRDVRLCAYGSYQPNPTLAAHQKLHFPDVRQALTCTLPPDPGLLGGPGVLVVDDLVDTGATMADLAHRLPEAVRCVLYAKPAGLPRTHLYSRAVPQDVWVRFPWEMATGVS